MTKIPVIKEALPDGMCDICHKQTTNLDLYPEGRWIVCHDCSKQIQSGDITLLSPTPKVYEVEGWSRVEKRVVAHSKSAGRIYVPANWTGGRAVAILVELPPQVTKYEE